MPGGALLRWFFRGQVARYRKNAGPEPPRFMDFPAVVLTTKGARTGHEHSHVLGGFQDGADGHEAWLVVASKGGAPTHPHWFINLAKHPEHVWLEVGSRKLQVRPVLLEGKEREEALARIAAVSPRYGEYQKKTDREIPIIRLTPIS
jgi:deazaflavin-dependent oxidoreductase (nitroreductase family)